MNQIQKGAILANKNLKFYGVHIEMSFYLLAYFDSYSHFIF